NNNFDIGIIAYLFNKSRIYIVLFFLVSFTIAFLYLRYSQPVYESVAILQINESNHADNILKLDNFEGQTNDLAKAIEQIRSKVFLKRVVEKLDISVNYYSEGTFKNNELYHQSPYLVKINPKSGIRYGQKIYVEINNTLTGGTIKVGGRTEKFTINNWLKLKEFDINIYVNPEMTTAYVKELLRDNKAFYFIVSDVEAVTAGIQSKLEVKVMNESAKTILLRVKDVNSAKSTDIVNAITEEYLTYDVERKSESSRSILAFIDGQLDAVYNDLKTNESDLQRFKKDKNFSDKDILLNSELLRYTSVEDQLLKVEMEEKLIAEIQNNITKNKGIDIYELISLISGTDYESSIKDVTQSIQKLLVEKENLLYQVTPSSEQIKQINYQIETQKKLLLESLDAIRLKYKSKAKNLLEKSSDFKSKFNQKDLARRFLLVHGMPFSSRCLPRCYYQ
ncbi:MAG: wzc, partial [Bacteroidetes bacterium]|nr:wzc [Bacteroidota bacterium]